jgi:hypothetical protein
MNRREFLHTSAATAASAAAASAATILSAPAVHGEDKAGTKPAVVGDGAFKYECNHNWGELPEKIRWQTTHGVAVDSAGLVYVTHQGAGGKDAMDTVVVFDPAGKYVRSFGKEYAGGGHGIDIRKEGSEEFIYLSNVNGGGPVAKVTLKGETVWRKWPTENGPYTRADAFKPTNVAFAPDGGFYVGDGYGSHYVHRYDKDGKWVSTFGGPGKDASKLSTPHGLWWDDRPGREASLCVCDRANNRLQYFTADGKHLSFVKDVSYPAHIDIRGEVMLVADLHARVSLFDKDNKVIAHLGYDPEWTKKVLDGFKVRTKPAEWVDGRFVHPHDACFDKDGNILVAEWVSTGRVGFLKKLA